MIILITYLSPPGLSIVITFPSFYLISILCEDTFRLYIDQKYLLSKMSFNIIGVSCLSQLNYDCCVTALRGSPTPSFTVFYNPIPCVICIALTGYDNKDTTSVIKYKTLLSKDLSLHASLDLTKKLKMVKSLQGAECCNIH